MLGRDRELCSGHLFHSSGHTHIFKMGKNRIYQSNFTAEQNNMNYVELISATFITEKAVSEPLHIKQKGI